jgi:hypothetical protein
MMVQYAQRKGFNVEVREYMEIEDLHEFVDKQHPVIVLIQAWPLDDMPVYNWTRGT